MIFIFPFFQKYFQRNAQTQRPNAQYQQMFLNQAKNIIKQKEPKYLNKTNAQCKQIATNQRFDIFITLIQLYGIYLYTVIWYISIYLYISYIFEVNINL